MLAYLVGVLVALHTLAETETCLVFGKNMLLLWSINKETKEVVTRSMKTKEAETKQN